MNSRSLHFLDLPNEIITEIVNELDHDSVLDFANVCHRSRAIVKRNKPCMGFLKKQKGRVLIKGKMLTWRVCYEASDKDLALPIVKRTFRAMKGGEMEHFSYPGDLCQSFLSLLCSAPFRSGQVSIDNLSSTENVRALLSILKPKHLAVYGTGSIDCSEMALIQLPESLTSISLDSNQLTNFRLFVIPPSIPRFWTNANTNENDIINIVQEWYDGKRTISEWNIAPKENPNTRFDILTILRSIQIAPGNRLRLKRGGGYPHVDHFLFRPNHAFPLQLTISARRFLWLKYDESDELDSFARWVHI